MKNLKQGQRIEFHITDDLNGTGIIVGIATLDFPIIGATYIIQPDNSIRSETYDYTHFVAFESQFKLIE